MVTVVCTKEKLRQSKIFCSGERLMPQWLTYLNQCPVDLLLAKIEDFSSTLIGVVRYYLANFFFFTKYVGLQRLSVFVCHIIFGHSFQAIILNCFVYVGDQKRTATLNFGEDPNPDLDLRIFISRRAQSAKREI